VHRLLFRKRLYDAVVALLCGGRRFSLVVFPKQSVSAAKDGLTLCLNVIIHHRFFLFLAVRLLSFSSAWRGCSAESWNL
jgi:hypothetical protein